MKKFLALLLASLLVFSCVFALASCGSNNDDDKDGKDSGDIPDGEYTASEFGMEMTMVVRGNEITGEMVSGDTGATGAFITYTYKLNADATQILMTFASVEYDGEDKDVISSIEAMEEQFAENPTMTAPFAYGDGYISIMGIKYYNDDFKASDIDVDKEDDGDDAKPITPPDDGRDTVDEIVGMTPEEIYEAALAKVAAAGSYEMVSTQDVVISYQGQSMTITQTVNSIMNGDDIYMEINSPMAEVHTYGWYIDEMLYSYDAISGQKVKAELTREEYMAMMNADSTESTLLNIPESWFSDIRFYYEEGEYYLEFVIPADNYNEMFGNLNVAGEVVGDVVYRVYFTDDGELDYITNEVDILMNGTEAHAVTTSVITIGEYVVDPPADADSYLLGNI